MRYSISLKGYNIDRTINRLYNDNIVIFNLNRKAYDEVSFEILQKDYKNVKRYISNYILNIKNPLDIFRKEMILPRIFAIILLPLIIGFAIFTSQFIWKIKIIGNTQIKTQDILTVLSENGIEVRNKKVLNTSEMEDILLKELDIAQVSCFYRGTTLMINISEKLVYVPKSFSPIVAKYDGIIKNYVLKKGSLNFQIGDYVSKGDILVYPFIIDKNGTKINVEPEADIYATNYVNVTLTKNEKETLLVSSNKKKVIHKISYHFATNRDIIRQNPFVFYEVKVYNKYISDVLPIVRQKYVYYELVEIEKVNDLYLCIDDLEELSKEKVIELVPSEYDIINSKTYSLIANQVLYSTTIVNFYGSIT